VLKVTHAYIAVHATVTVARISPDLFLLEESKDRLAIRLAGHDRKGESDYHERVENMTQSIMNSPKIAMIQ
jgi:hypothetical protein